MQNFIKITITKIHFCALSLDTNTNTNFNKNNDNENTSFLLERRGDDVGAQVDGYYLALLLPFLVFLFCLCFFPCFCLRVFFML